MSAQPVKEPEKQLRQSERKWGKSLIDTGFTVIPTIVLEYQQRLEIDATDLALLLQIIKHWWEPDKAPFPSRKSLAECIGCDISTVQRHLTKLRRKNLIEIEHRFDKDTRGQTSSSYTFNGLIEKATIIAEEVQQIRKQQKEDVSSVRKRRPRTRTTPDLKIAD